MDHHGFDDHSAEAFVKLKNKMSSEGRMKTLNLDAFIPFIEKHTPKSASVVDLCCGSGVLTSRLVHIDSISHLYAQDINHRCIEACVALGVEGKSVTPILATRDNPGLVPDSFDVAICLSSFHDIDSSTRISYLTHIAESLHVGGKLIVTDFRKVGVPHSAGPPLSRRVSSEAAKAELEAAGLHVEEIITGFPSTVWWTMVSVKK